MRCYYDNTIRHCDASNFKSVLFDLMNHNILITTNSVFIWNKKVLDTWNNIITPYIIIVILLICAILCVVNEHVLLY